VDMDNLVLHLVL